MNTDTSIASFKSAARQVARLRISTLGVMRLVLALLLMTPCLMSVANDHVSLNSTDGTQWQVFPASTLRAVQVSKVGYTPKSWVDGIVPGTVFAAYVAAGHEEDPSYGDNIYRVDETKYNRSFWYRTEFERPTGAGTRAVLVLEGTNRTSEVWFNGKKLGTIKGHMMKARYDITALLADHNALAVRVNQPKSEFLPRTSNFVNYVCPTYVASHSWDWVPYVPGLNEGITNDIYIEMAGDVTLRDPWTRSTLRDDNSSAALHQQTSIVNLTAADADVTLRATIMPGNLTVSKDVHVAAGDSMTVMLDDVTVDNPLLWWPNGMGKQNLYTSRYEVVSDGRVIDTKTVSFGIRRYTYKKENTAMVVRINGRKVYCKGGNWGMSDYMLQCRGDEYDLRLRLHREMNYNMIRLWTGCVTDEEFYDACDKYGIMVWDDFWLTGPYTGLTGPNDRAEFIGNVRDKVVRLRNHPSIAVWCGCNEGWPYDELNNNIIDVINTYDAADRVYIPNSHNGYPTRASYEAQDESGLGLSGSGWWTNFPPEEYFSKGVWGGGGDRGDREDWGFRSELGMAAFTSFESFREFMPEDSWWPRNDMWEKHFFSNQAAYGGGADANKYFSTVERGYGTCHSAQEFCERAQFVNIEVMKALYEGWQDNLWNTATGLLFWMSQSAYPCFIWQTYDYYYDATGTYWGAKKACEPQHIQWNCSNGNINVVNTSADNVSGATAEIEVRRLDGSRYEPLCSRVENVNAPSNAVTRVGNIARAASELTGMYFIKLRLSDVDGNTISDNFYWKSADGTKDDYTKLNSLPSADITGAVQSCTIEGHETKMRVNVVNNSPTVAFGVRLRFVDESTGKRILPVIMPDNYITLMPGESRDMDVEFDNRFNPDVTPVLMLKQYGYDEQRAAVADGISAVERPSQNLRLQLASDGSLLSFGIDADEVTRAAIVSAGGTTVMVSAGQSAVDVSHLPAGLYMVTVTTSDGRSLKGKVIKR